MSESGTMSTEPPGSDIHVLGADSGTVDERAAVDRSRRCRRVRLDTARLDGAVPGSPLRPASGALNASTVGGSGCHLA